MLFYSFFVSRCDAHTYGVPEVKMKDDLMKIIYCVHTGSLL